MAFWGKKSPVILYGGSFSLEWDLNLMDCTYSYSWNKERILHKSVITGKMWSHDLSQNPEHGRMHIDLTIFNMNTNDMAIFLSLRNNTALKIRMHNDGDAAPWEEVFLVEQYQPFAGAESEIPYPAFDCGYIKLVSENYINLPDS